MKITVAAVLGLLLTTDLWAFGPSVGNDPVMTKYPISYAEVMAKSTECELYGSSLETMPLEEKFYVVCFQGYRWIEWNWGGDLTCNEVLYVVEFEKIEEEGYKVLGRYEEHESVEESLCGGYEDPER